MASAAVIIKHTSDGGGGDRVRVVDRSKSSDGLPAPSVCATSSSSSSSSVSRARSAETFAPSTGSPLFADKSTETHQLEPTKATTLVVKKKKKRAKAGMASRIFGDDCDARSIIDMSMMTDLDRRDDNEDKVSGRGILGKDYDELLRNGKEGHGGDNEDDDDDCGSVSSSSTVGYYESSDFASVHWNHHMLPLAVVASGIALVHPLLFLAGALTAFGTVQAAGVGYDYWTTGWNDMLVVGGTAESAQESVEARNGALEREEDLTAMVDTTSSRHSNDACVTVTDETKLEAVPMIHPEPHSENLRSANTKQISQDTLQSNCTDVSRPPAQRQKSLFESDPCFCQNTAESVLWVKHHYPPMKNISIQNQEFYGLNAKEFFNVFFADDAPYTFQAFQKARNDKDIQYGLWKDIPHVRHPSMYADGTAKECQVLVQTVLRERVLNFHARTNSFIGPPYAKTTKVQRVMLASKRLLVLEAKTTVTDIPFADRFYVMERWIITANKQLDGRYVSTLQSIQSEVAIVKKCPFESQIVSKSRETFAEMSKAWCCMALESLKLTEERRKERLRKEGVDDDDISVATSKQEIDNDHVDEDQSRGDIDDADGDCVEVQAVGPCLSWVLNEPPPESIALPLALPAMSASTTPLTPTRKNRRFLGKMVSRYVRRKNPRSLSPPIN